MRDDVPFTYRPIDSWPVEETRNRQRAPFTAGWGTTLELLMRELRYLRARQVVCQVALDEGDFRVTDGHPKARAVARHPGVILAFESKHGPLKFYCDTFTSFDDNMRAIALGLEALRRVERYGITNRAEQYAGWKQIGSGRTTGEAMSKDEAWYVLCDLAEVDTRDRYNVRNVKPELRTREDVERLYRHAAKLHHPDQGGNRACFEAAVAAREVLLA